MMVLVFEEKDRNLVLDRLGHNNADVLEPIAFYEMPGFFTIEKFKTLEEVEAWWKGWEDK